MTLSLDVQDIHKSFRIPSVRRHTIREHLLDALRRHPSEELPILRGISFSVERGETLGIMGRNGCGKSTLLKIICEIFQPDRGRVRIAGGLTPILELGVGWNPELDAVDNVFLLGSLMGVSLAELNLRLDEILAFAEVERFAKLPLKHYSSGMAARLSFAIAFHSVREILVLDEIFAVGDLGFRAKCADRLREFQREGHTVILVSHEPEIISSFCSRALLIENGQTEFVGSGAETAARYLQLACSGHATEAASAATLT